MSRLVAILLVVVAGLSIYALHEKNSVLKYKEEQRLLTDALVTAMKDLVDQHTKESQDNAEELIRLKNTHENIVNTLRSEYTGRLQQHEERAEHYRSLSEASPTECRSLGDITTRLDKSLETGRYLVTELRNRLELREKQLIVVGKQLKADRQLFGQEY